MRTRAARLGVVVLLLAAAGAAAFLLQDSLRIGSSASDIDARADQLLGLNADIVRAQAAYVVPGQDPTPALERFPQYLQDVTRLTAEISQRLESPEARKELQAFVDATSALVQADGAAREQLLLGDVLTASHVIFGDGARAAAGMSRSIVRVRELDRLARAAAASERATYTRVVLGATGAVWLLGLLLLAFVGPRQRSSTATAAAAEPDPPAVAEEGPGLNLDAAAALCTDIARVETPAQLNGLLTRAVELLDADGMIVWIESAGTMMAAAAAGYRDDMLVRVSPVQRGDEHATAKAWREGTAQTVDATVDRHGALAIPLFNGAACRGVLAVGLKPGREHDALTRDVTRMIAAQLSAVVLGAVSQPSEALATGA